MVLFQAGDMYEKIRDHAQAMSCFKKGKAYRRGTDCSLPVFVLTILKCSLNMAALFMGPYNLNVDLVI